MGCGEEGWREAVWEHKEQLYLLEVLVDEVLIEKDDSYSLDSPVLSLEGRVSFLDLPDMLVHPNELLTAKRKKQEEEVPRIPGLPETWQVEVACDLADFKRFPQYRVTLGAETDDMNFVITVLVPKIAVEAGEGLRYTFTALERKVDPEIMNIIKSQIKEALEKEKDKKDIEEPIVFASGKSCLFQMTPFDLIKALNKYPFYVTLYRQGVVEGIPLTQLVGKVKLYCADAFTKAITAAETADVFPVAAHLEDTFVMENIFGDRSGTIGLFVRLSCFGCTIAKPLVKLLSPDAEEVEEVGVRSREAMLAEDEAVLLDARGWRPYKDHVPITWRRAEEVLGADFTPSLAQLMPALRSMPPPPPRAGPPPDPWLEVSGLPRCGAPGVSPPCYRRPGDPPLPPCTRAREEQMCREERTKVVQTEPLHVVGRLPRTSPYVDRSVAI